MCERCEKMGLKKTVGFASLEVIEMFRECERRSKAVENEINAIEALEKKAWEKIGKELNIDVVKAKNLMFSPDTGEVCMVDPEERVRQALTHVIGKLAEALGEDEEDGTNGKGDGTIRED